MQYSVSPKDVVEALARIRPYVHRTPLLGCTSISSLSSQATGLPTTLAFKCELFQRSGSFKMRGAMNAVLSLPSESASLGVCTHSSGNHAQALALAASTFGCPSHIVMPSNSPSVKKEATLGYGAAVIECEPTQAAREGAAKEVASRTGATFIHPSENPHVIAGQGTLVLELLQQAEEVFGPALLSPPQSAPLDVLIVPVGGGGLISGCALALQTLSGSPHLPIIIGAEPAEAADAYRSKKSGLLQGHTSGPPSTIADGLKTTLGPNTWPIVRDFVSEIITVSEEEIKCALRLVYERAKLAIEPSAAVGVAVATSPALGVALRALLPSTTLVSVEAGERKLRVGIVLCGGNSDYKG